MRSRDARSIELRSYGEEGLHGSSCRSSGVGPLIRILTSIFSGDDGLFSGDEGFKVVPLRGDDCVQGRTGGRLVVRRPCSVSVGSKRARARPSGSSAVSARRRL